MSYLQPFNYSFSSFPGSPFGQFSGYSSPTGNQLLPQTPQQQAAQFPLPQSIAGPNSDYYGNPNPVGNKINNNNHNNQNPISFQNAQFNLNQNQNQNQPLQGAQPSEQQNQIYNSDNIQGGQQFLSQQQQQQQIPHQRTSQSGTRKRRPKNSRTRSIGLENTSNLRVTPIQGPIYAKDGFLPVVPLYSYPAVNNGTFYQIPILWTALSYALGLEIRGEILRGLPCIKRLNQLFCPTAGTTYPLNKIESFIDENKALIKRMYGEFQMNPGSFDGSGGNSLRRSAREVYEDEVPDFFNHDGFINKRSHQTSGSPNSTINSHIRTSRQTVNPKNGSPITQPKSNRVDSCESTTEITTPFWAANSSGKVRAIVNTQHFEQAIHQEVCAKSSTKRCSGECGCEQKYKWHRLLAYEPDNDCKGIFMDWFLFPSCCVCRCNPTTPPTTT